MKYSHYINIVVEGGNINDSLSEIMQAVHYTNFYGNELSVDFVKFNSTVQNDFGDTVRIFGNTKSLYDFFISLSECSDLYNLNISSITEIPETTNYVSYVRDRVIDNLTPSNIKRKKIRAIMRGERYEPKSIDYPSHTLIMPSSKGSFLLHVKKSDKESEGGIKYGLGNLVPVF